MSEFEYNPSCLLLGSGGTNTKTTGMANQGEYYTLEFPDFATKQIPFGNGVSYDQVNNPNNFQFSQKGVFLVQTMFTLQGGANDEYKLRLYNNKTQKELDYTEIYFSTKGTNYWEVQNMFLLYNDGSLKDNSAFLSYNITYSYQIQRVINAVGNITINNMNVIIYKIA